MSKTWVARRVRECRMLSRRAAAVFAVALFVAACVPADDVAAPGTTAVGSATNVASESVTLRLIAHDSFTPTEGIFDEFTKETGVQVEVVRSGDSGTLVTKAVLAAGNPEADVLWGVDNTLLSRAVEADVFVPYESVHRSDLDAAAVALAPNGEVTPVDTGDVCINYDKAWFAERGIAPPLTLQALASANYRNLLVVPNPVSSSPGLAFLLATIAETGDAWTEWWKSMRDNGVLLVESWSDAYYGHFTAASEGTRPLVVSYATSPPAEVIFADPRPAQVIGAVQLTDLAGDVALEQANPHHQREQGKQEQPLKRHQEVAQSHDNGARQQRGPSAQPAVSNQPAGNRGQVDQAGVIAKDRRGERLAFLAAIGRALQPLQPQHIADVFGQQQVLDHIEHQQGLHGIVGKPLTPLDEGEVTQPLGVAQKGPVVGRNIQLWCGFGSSHVIPRMVSLARGYSQEPKLASMGDCPAV